MESKCYISPMDYRLLDGDVLDLSKLPRRDTHFLLDLMQRALADEDYFALELSVCGKDAYPLKGSPRVTLAVHATPLFRVAEDIAYRAGIRQGVLAPEPGDRRAPMDEIMSVSQAARALRITRSAVIKAARTGRIKGTKVGHTWALLRTSVRSYRVAAYRVAAGRAAHRK
jgi:excisionase family DNA binding protein